MSMHVVIDNYRECDREQCRSLWRELTEWHREIYQDQTIEGGHLGDLLKAIYDLTGFGENSSESFGDSMMNFL